jgi:hypothetical protein
MTLRQLLVIAVCAISIPAIGFISERLSHVI